MSAEETIDECADVLEVWRKERRALLRRVREAWKKLREDEQRLRRLRKELAAAEEVLSASNAEAWNLHKQIDAHLAAGEKRGFEV